MWHWWLFPEFLKFWKLTSYQYRLQPKVEHQLVFFLFFSHLCIRRIDVFYSPSLVFEQLWVTGGWLSTSAAACVVPCIPLCIYAPRLWWECCAWGFGHSYSSSIIKLLKAKLEERAPALCCEIQPFLNVGGVTVERSGSWTGDSCSEEWGRGRHYQPLRYDWNANMLQKRLFCARSLDFK